MFLVFFVNPFISAVVSYSSVQPHN